MTSSLSARELSSLMLNQLDIFTVYSSHCFEHLCEVFVFLMQAGITFPVGTGSRPLVSTSFLAMTFSFKSSNTLLVFGSAAPLKKQVFFFYLACTFFKRCVKEEDWV